MDRLEVFKERVAALPAGGVQIPRQGGEFNARPVWADDGQLCGVAVDNLGESSFLSLDVFASAIALLETSGGRARKGNAMSARLGDPDLAMDSVEGRIATDVYGQQVGASVFRRITPVSRLLEWAGICKSEKGYLYLADSR